MGRVSYLLPIKLVIKYKPERISKVLFFILMVWMCIPFVQASESCSRLLKGNPKYLDWTYYGSISGVKGHELPGKQVSGHALPKNPPGVASFFYFKSKFSVVNEATGSQLEFSEKENPNWVATKELFQFVYQIYNKRGSVPESWLVDYQKMDSKLTFDETGFIAFSDPVSHEPLVVIRIVDGSPTHNFRLVREPIAIPIEKEFPFLMLPDRQNGNDDIIEFGRLAKDESRVDGDISSLLRPLAIYVGQSHYDDPISLERKANEPAIYVEASAIGVRYYSRYGFKKIFGPTETKKPDTYILRLGGDELGLPVV